MPNNVIQETNNVAMYIAEEGDTWAGGVIANLTDSSSGVAATATTNKFTGQAGFFNEIAVGATIKTTGFVEAANNGVFTVIAKSADGAEITVDGALATEAANTSAILNVVWHNCRYTGGILKEEYETKSSEEISENRRRKDDALLFAEGSGTMNFLLSFPELTAGYRGAHGRLMEGALQDVFVKTEIVAATAPDTLVFDGVTITSNAAFGDLKVGQFIRVKNTTGGSNDGIFRVSAKSDDNTTITVVNPFDSTWTAFATQTETVNATIIALSLRDNKSKRSYKVEYRHGDIGVFDRFDGVRVGSMNLKISSKSIIEGSFNLAAKCGTPNSDASNAVEAVSAGTNPVMTASANIGAIVQDGTVLSTALKSIDLTIDNNLQSRDILASKYPSDFRTGFFDISGTVTALFEDLALYNKAKNHTLTDLVIQCQDDNGNTIIFTIPKVYLYGGPDVSGGNDDATLSLELKGVEDAANDYAFQIDMLPA